MPTTAAGHPVARATPTQDPDRVIDDLDFYCIEPATAPREAAEIHALLASCGLRDEDGIEAFIVYRPGGRLIGCAGLERNIVKCVATDPHYRGEALTLKLVSEVTKLAYARGQSHLFLFTRPESVAFFHGCGFYRLAEMPGYVALLENTPIGIRSYCDRLAALRRPGAAIGAIVMHANPFTYGHRHLVDLAAGACDWLHVFVVGEETPPLTYADRYAMVERGVTGIGNVTLHHGSPYILSRATFPAYFLKDMGSAEQCCTAIDLLLFRNFIAPALGITHRYVADEPFSATTRQYNADMRHWLRTAPTGTPALVVVEVPRLQSRGVPISATEVRRLWNAGDVRALAALVPPTTLHMLQDKYHAVRFPPVAARAVASEISKRVESVR